MSRHPLTFTSLGSLCQQVLFHLKLFNLFILSPVGIKEALMAMTGMPSQTGIKEMAHNCS